MSAGENVANVMKRRRVFFREEAATRQALTRWTPAMLAVAHARVRAAERTIMSSGTAGEVHGGHVALEITRRIGEG